MSGQGKNNQLSQSETVRLRDWIVEHRAAAEKKTAKALAAAAELALGFQVTESNVGTWRRTLGIRRPVARKAAGGCAEDCVVEVKLRKLAAALLDYELDLGHDALKKFHDVLVAISGRPTAPELPLKPAADLRGIIVDEPANDELRSALLADPMVAELMERKKLGKQPVVFGLEPCKVL